MAAQDLTVSELVEKVERGTIRLPELQRGVVWKGSKVRDLLDSLYRGYPSGTILTWETDEPVSTREFGVDQETPLNDSYQLLLDGQQRLTALSAVLRGVPIKVKDRVRPISILFNLDHPEHPVEQAEIPDDDDEDGDEPSDESNDDKSADQYDTFALHSNKLASQPNWISVTEALKAKSDRQILLDARVSGFDDPRFDRYSKRLERLREIAKYKYRVDVLDRSKSYEEVTDIFVRVNSSGMTLRSSDLALAQITARWRDSLVLFLEFADKTTSRGYDLDLSIHLKVLVAMATGQSRFRHIGRASTRDLQDGWRRAKPGIEFAIDFLNNNVRATSPISLSSPFVVVALAVYGDFYNYKLQPGDPDKLRRWVLAASVKGRYSGASETTLDADISAIQKGQGIDGLLRLLETQTVRLSVEPIELMGATSRSPFFRTMFLAFTDAGAKDWDDGIVIAVNHLGAKHRIEFHHIFPQDFMENTHPKSEINDLANLAFLSSRKNKRLGNTPPEDYLSTIEVEQLSAQCIPTDPALWKKENYGRFLDARRRLIAARLNVFMDVQRESQIG